MALRAGAGVRTVIKGLFFLLTIFSLYSNEVYFVPPAGWDLINPQNLGKRVKVGFALKNSSTFAPSLNLAEEKLQTPLSVAEYVAAVKKIHLSNPNNRWRDLGAFKSPAGPCHLTELETKTKWGQVRLLQLFFIQDKTAYILTASALKEEFSQFYASFKKAFDSLNSSSHLLSSLPDVKKRERLSLAYDKLSSSCLSHEEWEKMVVLECPEMGAYWQALLIKQTREITCKKEHP